MTQIINITSEALQATIRRLLPSQQGFGEDLKATNLVTPIIDLTPTAEGSVLRADLQRALDYSVSTVAVNAATTSTIVATAGFYRTDYVAINASATNARIFSVQITDGTTSKDVLLRRIAAGDAEWYPSETLFLRPGDSFTVTTGADVTVNVFYRQIADVYGNLTPPNDFVFE